MLKAKSISRVPILLSAVVCPGAGQFVQKRWMAGIIFVAGFLWGFFWSMILAVGNIIEYYKMAFEFDAYEPNPVAPSAFIAPVAIAGIFYLVNLFDVLAAQQRMRQKQHQDLFTKANTETRSEAGNDQQRSGKHGNHPL